MSIKKALLETFKNMVAYFKVYSPSEIKVSDKSVGGKVEMINADGTLSAAEDGDYSLEDGFSFSVKAGVIDSIVGEVAQAKPEAVPASGSTETVKAADAVVETPADEAAEDNAMADLTARVDAIEKMIKEFMDQMNMEKTESASAVAAFSIQVKELNDNIKTLAKIPAQFTKVNTSPSAADEKQEKMMDLAKLLGSMK